MFARTIEPPYYAVIFTSRRSGRVDEEYRRTAERMAELAANEPGFLGLETVADADGHGITVSYWESEEAIAAWKANADHRAARLRGRREWYEHYELRVARVERAYSGPAEPK